MTAAVRVERRANGVTTVTVDSPPLNLYDAALHAEFRSAVDNLAGNPPRAVLIQADGRVVSAGMDVAVFDGLHTVDDAVDYLAELMALTRQIQDLPCPTVFAAHGLCLTWAFEVALACDLILATDRAGFGLIERTIGLIPAMGGIHRLAQRAGSARAAEMVLTGGCFEAATLERWNVVNRVLPVSGFREQALAVAGQLAVGPPRAQAAFKRVLNRSRVDDAGLDRFTAEVAGGLFAGRDLRDAVRSHLRGGPGRAVFRGD